MAMIRTDRRMTSAKLKAVEGGARGLAVFCVLLALIAGAVFWRQVSLGMHPGRERLLGPVIVCGMLLGALFAHGGARLARRLRVDPELRPKATLKR